MNSYRKWEREQEGGWIVISNVNLRLDGYRLPDSHNNNRIEVSVNQAHQERG